MPIYQPVLPSNSKISFISAPPGTGKSTLVKQVIQTTPNANFVFVVEKYDLAVQTAKDLNLDSSSILFSETVKGDLLSTITDTIIHRKKHVCIISTQMFWRLDVSILEHDDIQVFNDDSTGYYKAIDGSITVEQKILMAGIYSQIFEVTGNVVSHYAPVKFRDDIEQSQHMIEFMKQFDELKYYRHMLINADALLGQSDSFFVIGYHDLTEYQNVNLTFIANEFEQSVIYEKFGSMMTQYQHNLQFNLKANNARFDVKYFLECEPGKYGMTNGLMDREFGKKKTDANYITQMERISQYIMEKEDMNDFYWMANEKYIDSKRRGGFTLPVELFNTPNQKGINSLRDKTSCAVLTSIKFDNYMISGIEETMGHSRDKIYQQMELEMINQNIYRGIARDWSSTDRMTVYVYDERQAMSIQDAGSYEYIDLGFERKQAGRPPSSVPANVLDAFRYWRKTGTRNLNDLRNWLKKPRKDKETGEKFYLSDVQKDELFTKFNS